MLTAPICYDGSICWELWHINRNQSRLLRSITRPHPAQIWNKSAKFSVVSLWTPHPPSPFSTKLCTTIWKSAETPSQPRALWLSQRKEKLLLKKIETMSALPFKNHASLLNDSPCSYLPAEQLCNCFPAAERTFQRNWMFITLAIFLLPDLLFCLCPITVCFNCLVIDIHTTHNREWICYPLAARVRVCIFSLFLDQWSSLMGSRWF